MARVRLSKTHHAAESPAGDKDPARNHPGRTPMFRGLTERQWFIGLLVASGLLLLFTFRGCILPSGVGPKSKPSPKPSPTATATPAPSQTATEYTVQAGDTLSKIAGRHGVTLEALAQANNIDLHKPVILHVGDKLRIPK